MQNIKEEIRKIIEKAVEGNLPAQAVVPDFSIEISANKEYGDYSSNVALILAKKINKNPKDVASLIKEKIKSDIFKKIEVVNGFINFFIADKIFVDNLKKINKNCGKGSELKNEKIIFFPKSKR